MTTVEEIIDAIRAHFSPLDVVDISKSSPLQAKLRLLAYQISKDDKPDTAELAQEWYLVEADKFYKKPCASRFSNLGFDHCPPFLLRRFACFSFFLFSYVKDILFLFLLSR